MPSVGNPFNKIPPVNEDSLVCKIGDRLVVHTPELTEEGERIEVGALYEVSSRTGYGWNLSLLRGGGAKVVRVLNSRLLSIFKPQDHP
jgi:hypothetical protein